jgi:hypothetical protein
VEIWRSTAGKGCAFGVGLTAISTKSCFESDEMFTPHGYASLFQKYAVNDRKLAAERTPLIARKSRI